MYEAAEETGVSIRGLVLTGIERSEVIGAEDGVDDREHALWVLPRWEPGPEPAPVSGWWDVADSKRGHVELNVEE